MLGVLLVSGFPWFFRGVVRPRCRSLARCLSCVLSLRRGLLRFRSVSHSVLSFTSIVSLSVAFSLHMCFLFVSMYLCRSLALSRSLGRSLSLAFCRSVYLPIALAVSQEGVLRIWFVVFLSSLHWYG